MSLTEVLEDLKSLLWSPKTAEQVSFSFHLYISLENETNVHGMRRARAHEATEQEL